MKRLLDQLDRTYLTIDRRLRGWPTLLIRTGLAFGQDDGALVSRSIAYYALLSLFPLLLALMAIATSVLDSEEAQRLVLEAVERYLPSAVELVQDNILQALEARGTIGIIALVGLLWSGSGVFSAVYRAVNRAWGNGSSERFWADKLFGLAVVLLAGLLLVGMTFYSTIAGVVRSWEVSLLGWQPGSFAGSGTLWGWVSALLPALISVVFFIVLYRIVPRGGVAWREVWLGGLVAGLAWEAARQLLTWYLANFARHSLVYGSVGAIIGLLLWAYLGAMILLIGAEFTAQYASWRRAGRPLESRPPSQWLGAWAK